MGCSSLEIAFPPTSVPVRDPPNLEVEVRRADSSVPLFRSSRLGQSQLIALASSLLYLLRLSSLYHRQRTTYRQLCRRAEAGFKFDSEQLGLEGDEAEALR